MDLGFLDEAEALLAHELNMAELPEGYTVPSTLWFDLKAKRVSQREGIPVTPELLKQMRRDFPPPHCIAAGDGLSFAQEAVTPMTADSSRSKALSVIRLEGVYVQGWGSATPDWHRRICPMQEQCFPRIRQMVVGTFNVRLTSPGRYEPSDIRTLREANGDQSCISQVSRVVEINGRLLEAWIYDGGWPDDTVELLSEVRLAETLGIRPGDKVVLIVEDRMGNCPPDESNGLHPRGPDAQ